MNLAVWAEAQRCCVGDRVSLVSSRAVAGSGAASGSAHSGERSGSRGVWARADVGVRAGIVSGSEHGQPAVCRSLKFAA